MEIIVSFIIGVLLGGGAVWLLLKQLLAAEKEQAREKLVLLEEAKEKLSDAFKALASEVLKSSNTSFLELAKTQLEKYQESAKGDLEKRQTAIDELVKPVKESLGKVDAKLTEIEKSRIEAYSGLTEQVKSLWETQKELRGETANLVKALRRPQVRGRWGELQLQRVVEMAGMLEHCDFVQQQNINTESGRLRPDLVVHLPGGRAIAVDSKAPLEAYLEAIEAPDDETRDAKLREHARQVRNHVAALGKKSYGENLAGSLDIVVLFLPGESFYRAAMENDPDLLEEAAKLNVLIASPFTLIGLLRAFAHGWREEKLAENAKKISELGQELYKRLTTLGGNFRAVGEALARSIEHYNKAVGSLESRVLPAARRFKELGGGGDEIAELRQLENAPRMLQAPELVENDENTQP
ncbi:MAG: DNA recombination protein RmuC [Pirellulales bacterium]|nr:DNA recombination protein RmuC [Pirellulales bacterium]